MWGVQFWCNPPTLPRSDHDRSFLILLAAYRDRDHVEAATGSKLTTGTGDHNNAIALAPASDMSAPNLHVSEIAVVRHRYQRLTHSQTLNIHSRITSSLGGRHKVSITALT